MTSLKILQFFHMADSKPVISIIESYLISKISEENALGFYFNLKQYNLLELQTIAFNYALNQFCEVKTQNEFFDCDKESLQTYLKNPSIVADEDEIFNSVVDWVLKKNHLDYLNLRT